MAPKPSSSKVATGKKTKGTKKKSDPLAEIEKLKEKPKSQWTKAIWQKYSELLEKTQEPPQPNFDEAEEPPNLVADDANLDADPLNSPTVGATSERPDRRRVEPPKKSFDGTGDFEAFSRAVTIWSQKYPASVTDHQLGAELIEVVTGEAQETVFAHVPEGAETGEMIMAALRRRYGKKAMPKAMSAVENLASCKRGKKTLRSFLNDYASLRAKAETAGEVMCPNTSGTKLLSAAGLSPALHTQVLSLIAAQGGKGFQNMPTYDSVLDQLEILAQTYEAQDVSGETRKEKTVYLSEQKGAKKGKGKGKGKGKDKHGEKGKGKGKNRGKDGKGKAKGKGKGAGKGRPWEKPRCWEFDEKGTCQWGKECKFSHEPVQKGQKRESPTAEGEPAAKRDRQH